MESCRRRKQALKEKYLKKAQDLISKKKYEKYKVTDVSWSDPLITSTPLITRTRSTLPSSLRLSPHRDISELQRVIEDQNKAMKELKRLLLASVGGEMGTEIETLIRDKVTLESKLNHSITELMEMNEEIEGLTIECDVWKCKVLASRLLIDELREWKGNHYHLSVNTLQTLIDERDQLTNHIKAIHQLVNNISRKLMSTSSTANSTASGIKIATVTPVQLQPIHQGCNVLELAKNTSVAVQMISDKISARHEATPMPSLLSLNTSLTEGEKLAHKLLYPVPKETTPTSRGLPHLSFSEKTLMEQRKHQQARTLPWTDGHHDGNHDIANNNSYYFCNKCYGRAIMII
ncbi:PREDICTED: golgin-45-like [Amphimedon queenslandica]|uniref:Uncharacterized protein n=1 Tax=Amphimedon queenslandica TaxID=400682 RepID=A0A1X7SLJ5_AMPQE|nr:PREDICTED: golgin-45-like [Amphimedon queenslandica]|eukprot:XP_011409223.2 PREDICTED: golgin-45-like [Amphimedon queenslandica]